MATLTVSVDIPDADQVVLKNDLLDIDTWVQNAVTGKINSCKKRMARQAIAVLQADKDVTTMPADCDGLCAALAARGDYKDRVTLEAEK